MNYIIGNWKMNPADVERAKELFEGIKPQSKKVVVCPPFPYLPVLSEIDSEIELGAQNCFWRDRGAFTGEVSVEMLTDFGCEYVIVGHSERREVFKEDQEMISKKVKAVLEKGLTPILCVGETAEEREQDKTEQVLRHQVEGGLKRVEEVGSLIVGYEPRWAIGTGDACSPGQAEKSASVIREIEQVPVVYGGSVDSNNAASYLDIFEGLLIGGASLETEQFNEIIELA
ncbi:hypothetical protein AKJ56_00165 [candidate division MSBL1 archaeon SCGC-AAA382N08]|uniref:Triosephosphate isomerase n=1 Tax=candidate division MSBL1 archaeon SCGC-AAA382N08 TaxID=1698285 RepID=A0A133VR10_9EURY|nr:hypothetical protein AKJ56_00165 [candidate division MSBL1 archaeon SCGC-AAA382N08]